MLFDFSSLFISTFILVLINYSTQTCSLLLRSPIIYKFDVLSLKIIIPVNIFFIIATWSFEFATYHLFSLFDNQQTHIMSDTRLAAVDPEPATATSIDKQSDEKQLEKPVEKPSIDNDKPSEATTETDVPPLPSRPLSKIDLTINQLVDMFPKLDLKYIKMALIASEGRLEPASNALLFLSDPNSDIEIPSVPSNNSTSYPNLTDQYESDEILARNLAKSYEKRASNVSSTASRHRKSYHTPSMNENRPINKNFGNVDYDSDEDLYEAFTKNVNDAKQIVGGWFGNISKKIQESIEQPPPLPPKRSNYLPQRPISLENPYQQQQPHSIEKTPYNDDDENNYDGADNVAKSNSRKTTGILYPAVNHSDTSINIQTEPSSNVDNDKIIPPKPIKKDTTENSEINDNKKDDKKWTPLKENINDEPSNDAFLVEDSEDENDDDKAKVDKDE